VNFKNNSPQKKQKENKRIDFLNNKGSFVCYQTEISSFCVRQLADCFFCGSIFYYCKVEIIK
jgi:hypothetical protein